jgi:YHS domain-containing protein
MLKFVVLIVVGFILYKLITNDQRKKVEEQKQKKTEANPSEVMVKDPICGTYVSTDSEIRVKEGQDIHYFCSYECRDAFLDKKQDKSESET